MSPAYGYFCARSMSLRRSRPDMPIATDRNEGLQLIDEKERGSPLANFRQDAVEQGAGLAYSRSSEPGARINATDRGGERLSSPPRCCTWLAMAPEDPRYGCAFR